MNTMQLITNGFFIDYMNSMVLDGVMEGSIWDYQEALKLKDEDIEAMGENINLNNYECFKKQGGKQTYPILDTAEIGYTEQGGFTVHDIFGELIQFTVGHTWKAATMEDLLNQAYTPKSTPIKPVGQDFLDWCAKYQGEINQLVSLSFFIDDEYTPDVGDDYLLFGGDLEVSFQIKGQDYNIFSRSNLSIKEEQGNLILNLTALDICTDQQEHYESLLGDTSHLSQAEIEALIAKIEEQFYLYFNLEKVPMWQDRLLNSFKHDDLLEKIAEMKKLAA